MLQMEARWSMNPGRKGPRYLLVVAIAASIATIMQIYGTLRYVRRLPNDTLGVVLYIVTCVLFGVIATANYFRYAIEKKSD